MTESLYSSWLQHGHYGLPPVFQSVLYPAGCRNFFLSQNLMITVIGLRWESKIPGVHHLVNNIVDLQYIAGDSRQQWLTDKKKTDFLSGKPESTSSKRQ